MQKRKYLSLAIIPAVLTAVTVLCAQGLLRNLWIFLKFDPTFSQIFAQIVNAPMESPWVLTLVLLLGMTWLEVRLWPRKIWRIPAALAGIFAWLLLLALNVALTRVNGIRFVDVLLSLLDVAAKGGL